MNTRSRNRSRIVAAVGIIAFVAMASAVSAHPPHDIEGYVVRHSQSGVFAIYDTREGKALALKLDSIHQTGATLASGELLYCADFVDLKGKEYDLDFYIRDTQQGGSHDEGRRLIVGVVIHKVDGKDRLRPAEDAKPVDASEAEKIREAIAAHWKAPLQLWDRHNRTELTMTLDHVHDGVKALADGSFFACVDVRDGDGVLYDLDTFVRPNSGGYKVLEMLIHTQDGKERLR